MSPLEESLVWGDRSQRLDGSGQLDRSWTKLSCQTLKTPKMDELTTAVLRRDCSSFLLASATVLRERTADTPSLGPKVYEAPHGGGEFRCRIFSIQHLERFV